MHLNLCENAFCLFVFYCILLLPYAADKSEDARTYTLRKEKQRGQRGNSIDDRFAAHLRGSLFDSPACHFTSDALSTRAPAGPQHGSFYVNLLPHHCRFTHDTLVVLESNIGSVMLLLWVTGGQRAFRPHCH